MHGRMIPGMSGSVYRGALRRLAPKWNGCRSDSHGPGDYVEGSPHVVVLVLQGVAVEHIAPGERRVGGQLEQDRGHGPAAAGGTLDGIEQARLLSWG